jgi:hypothetical protein
VKLAVEAAPGPQPSASITLDDSPGAVPVPDALWDALGRAEAAILAYAAKWRRDQDDLRGGRQPSVTDQNAGCQMCGRPGRFPTCQIPIPGARFRCMDIWPAAYTGDGGKR